VDKMVAYNLDSFRGKKVFVTGDTGFKGSWLTLWLHDLGAEVYGYALAPEKEEDLFLLAEIDGLVEHEDGDIRDLNHLSKAVKKFQPDIIFHLAAQALVLRSYEEAKLTFDTNVGGSVNVLEVCRMVPSVRALIFVTSDKCYLNREWIWGYRENDRLGGQDPYSASKAAAELVFVAYNQSFFSKSNDFGAATVRAGNVIGGGDRSANRLVPDCIAALEEGKPLLIRNPRAVRPWQHLLDPLSGYLMLAAGLYNDPVKYSGSWNLGPSQEAMRSVEDLTRLIVEKWGEGKIEYADNKDCHKEAGLLYLNCDKAYHRLGWQPAWNFEMAVEKTVQWYYEVTKDVSPLMMMRKQLSEFVANSQA